MHPVGFTIEIYYDAWSYKRQIRKKPSNIYHYDYMYIILSLMMTPQKIIRPENVCLKRLF